MKAERWKRTRKIKTLILFILAFSLIFSTIAFADDDLIEEAIPPDAIVPEGNMSIVSELSGEAAESKEFITIVTKNGHYFYIIIDHSISGENSVHFLNKVDERDLLALLDEGEIDELTCTCTEKCGIGHINTDCPVCYLKMSDCLGLEPEPVIQPEPISEPEPSPVVEPPEDQPAVDSRVIVLAALLTVLIVLVIILIITGSRKPKVKGNTDLDEYYAEDEGYAEFEKYDPKEGGK